MFYIHYHSFCIQIWYECEYYLIVSVLQIRKLSLREVNWLAQISNLAGSLPLWSSCYWNCICEWSIGKTSTKSLKGFTEYYKWKASWEASVSFFHFYGDIELQRVGDLPFVIMLEKGENKVTKEKDVEEPGRLKSAFSPLFSRLL